LAAAIAHRRDHAPAAADADKARRAHQPGHALAADADAQLGQLGMDARRAVGAV